VNPALLADPRLLLVILISALVALLGTLNVAARPAAVLSGKVAQALSISSIFFMLSRFANMFYLPLVAGFKAHSEGPETLLGQIRWIIVGSAAGAWLSWILLPNFVSLYCSLVQVVDEQGVRGLFRPTNLVLACTSFFKRAPLPARLFRLEGISPGFLCFNIFATAVWTIGALSAIYCSAALPNYASTGLLLSGLVNAFAAIAFSVWVDPQAALITDQAVKGARPLIQVHSTALHLAVGNFLGSLLGLAMLPLGIGLITRATLLVGQQGTSVAGSIWSIVLLNAALTALASTTYAARVSAVQTRQVATALSIYNLFFLVTRLSVQVYAPMLGSLADHLARSRQLAQLEVLYRWVLAGATLGALLGLLLLPSFVEIINRAIQQLDRRGSIPAVLLACLNPRCWPTILSSFRLPGLLGVRLADLRQPNFPRTFLYGNVLVLSVHSVGLMAAIYAGAELGPEHPASGAATLLSSVVNGVATITLSLVVDPTLARVTDQCVSGQRDPAQIRTAAVFLLLGMLVGTVLAQVVFRPASSLISFGSQIFVLVLSWLAPRS
jgi:hypothetical protein